MVTQKQKYQDVSNQYINIMGEKIDNLIISYIKKPTKEKNKRLERLQIHYNFLIL